MTQQSWTIRFKGYLPVDDRMEERLRRVCAEIHNLPDSALHVDEEARVITIDYSQVKGWFEESREVVRTVRAGERIVVKPPWEDYEPQPDDVVLEIDPGTSFGSGLHESTRLCLQALEKYVVPGSTAADFGTGSGVLAIAAAKLGASRVIAFDAEPDAVESALANVARNGPEGLVEVRLAESAEFISSPVDLVTANLTGDTIARHAQGLARIVKAGGTLIASGVTTDNVLQAETALTDAGLRICEKLVDGRWVAVVCTV